MMARIVKEEDRAVKRNEILAAAQRLVYTKGYEQMAIQDILDELQISKGAFYHYFASKGALLEALTERMWHEAEPLISPIVQDPHLPAIEKLQCYFNTAARWKTEHKTYILGLLRTWYTDENAIVRQKVEAMLIKESAPMIGEIIRQGIQEGVMNTHFPDRAGEIVLSLIQSLGDAFAWLLLECKPNGDDLQSMERTVAAYTDALERILGAPPGSLTLMDAETIKEWFFLPRD